MMGEIRKARISALMAGVSVTALSLGAALTVAQIAHAQEVDIDNGGTLATGTAYTENDNDAGTVAVTTGAGAADITLGTTGDTTNDAFEAATASNVTITDNNTAGDLTFAGRVVTSSTGTISILLGDGNTADGTALFVFQDDIVEGSGAITITTDGAESDANTVQFDSTSGARSIDAAISDTTGNDDTLTVQTLGGNLVTFNDTLTNVDVLDIDTDTTFGAAVVIDTTTNVATGTTATFNDTTTLTGAVTVAGTGNLTLQDAGATHTLTGGLTMGSGTLTINSDQGTAVTASGSTVALTSTTIVLGPDIGNTDTVFDVSTAPGGFAVTTGLTVILDPGFTTGAIILEDDGTGGDDALISLAGGTVLRNYTIADAGSTTITAGAAKTAATIAGENSVSVDAANAVTQAQASVTASGTAAEQNAFAVGLGTASTTKSTIETAGSQADSVGGSVETAMAANGAAQDVVAGRLASVRSNGESHASAKTGFAAGDDSMDPMGAFWIRGFGGAGEADGEGAVAGFDSTYGGAVVGVDFEVDKGTRIGLFGSYIHAEVDGDGAGSSEVESHGFQLGFYVGRSTDEYYADLTVDYTYLDNETSRFVSATSTTASADYDAHVFSAALEVGVPYEFSEGAFITPKAGVDVTVYTADEYTESGAGAFNQTVDTDTVTEVVGLLGLRLHVVHEAADGVYLIPEVSAAAGYDFADDDATATTQFVGGGAAYTTTGTEIDPLSAQVGAGLALAWDSDVTFAVNYDGDLRDDYQSHTGRAELRIGF